MSVQQLAPPPRAQQAAPAQPAERYRKRLRRADLLVARSWVSVAIVVALFLSQSVATAFVTASDSITTVGILCGLVGTDLIMLMMVLAARVPIIDRTFGHDKAMLVHRKLGKPAFYLLLAHGIFLLIGYGMASGVNPVAEIGVMWATLPDVPLAFLAFGLLLVVIVSSFVAVRRRFPYEVWHAIHLLTYLAVLVAIPHQLSIGGLFVDGTLQRTYWLALYVVVAGLLVFYRFLLPIVRSLRHSLTVRRVVQIADGVVSIELSGRRLRELNAAGGQFLVWRFWTGKTWWHAHPLSLSAVPSETTLRITVRALGSGSGALASLPAGTRVSIEGPYGIFTQDARTLPHAVMVAAGIGVTPIRALIEQSALVPGEAIVIVRAARDQPPYLWQELRELCASKGVAVFLVEGSRSRTVDSWQTADAVERGYTLASYAPDVARSDLYVCGPAHWTDLVIRDARAQGLRQGQIHVERFDW
ncbi:MAG: ferredoxin reductase family protein [Lacisediminihabitans sp.]